MNDTNPIIPPITALSAAESNRNPPKCIRRIIPITDDNVINIKNITPPIYGNNVRNPHTAPIITLIIVINFNKDIFIKTLRFYLLLNFTTITLFFHWF